MARGSGYRGGSKSSIEAPVQETALTTRPRRNTLIESLPQWFNISSKKVESESLDECDLSPTPVEDEQLGVPRMLRSVSCINLPRSRSGLFRRASEETPDTPQPDTVLANYDPTQLGHYLNSKGVNRGRVGFLSDCEIKVEIPFVIGGFPNTLYEVGRRSVDTLPVYVGGSNEDVEAGEERSHVEESVEVGEGGRE